jgi:hypothetical protein
MKVQATDGKERLKHLSVAFSRNRQGIKRAKIYITE